VHEGKAAHARGSGVRGETPGAESRAALNAPLRGSKLRSSEAMQAGGPRLQRGDVLTWGERRRRSIRRLCAPHQPAPRSLCSRCVPLSGLRKIAWYRVTLETGARTAPRGEGRRTRERRGAKRAYFTRPAATRARRELVRPAPPSRATGASGGAAEAGHKTIELRVRTVG
jgi:hypothetical protein